ncbi:50S ribosomal protein L32 [Candidatus Falkowbacteria bacterium]|jgi:large subunit ribosomal protein L32|nr:50S ribosomal protein L32 [Patescibacteria group bacterium]NCU43146.1 50S ribosomal protein L32 [Candidatus Falkowbacteria bacterium]
MANPKKRKTHSAVGKGRAHLALKKVAINKCSKCGQPKLPHTACEFCGSYKGHEVVHVKSRLVK